MATFRESLQAGPTASAAKGTGRVRRVVVPPTVTTTQPFGESLRKKSPYGIPHASASVDLGINVT